MSTLGWVRGISMVLGAVAMLAPGAAVRAQIVPPPAQIDILPPQPSESDDILARLRGEWPDVCSPAPPVTTEVVGHEIRLTTSNLAFACAQVVTPYDVPVEIGYLDSGLYHVIFTHCTRSFGCRPIGERFFTVLACPFPSRDVRRSGDITCGPDLGGTHSLAVNFSGSAGAAGDSWLTVYGPDRPDPTSFTGSVSLAADVLIHRFNNKKGAGLLALFDETPGPGPKGLVLTVYDAGRTDTLVLSTLSEKGKLTTLKTMTLGAGILEDAWYRVTMDVLVDGDDLAVIGKVFTHALSSDPDSPVAIQLGGTLTTPTLSLMALGLQDSGQVGVVASAFSAVVDASVTNFEVTQDAGPQ